MPRLKEFYISGYWLDTKQKFENYKCCIGDYVEEWDMRDDDIFYWFDDEYELEKFLVENLSNKFKPEFVITEIEYV